MANYWQGDQGGWYNTPQSGVGAYDLGGTPYSDYGQPMDDSAPYYSTANTAGGFYPSSAQSYGGQMFLPDAAAIGATSSGGSEANFEDEPPLLEELGINFHHIRLKTLAVLNPLGKVDAGVIGDQDLAGPLVFCLLFGGALLLHGKVHFGYIYRIGVLGCLCMYVLLNLMAAGGISITCTVSVLGYCLLPMGLLSLMTAVFSFKGMVGLGVSGMAVLWCSGSAAKLFVTALDMHHQQLLVTYPCFLLYGVFALLAVF